MYDEAPISISARDLDAKEQCPASEGKITKRPSAPLERWKATNAALQGVLVGGLGLEEAVAQNASDLDVFQKEIVADRVRVAVELLDDRETTYDFDPDDRTTEVVVPQTDILLTAHKGMTATHSDGTIEYLKLRTGRYGTGPAEAAILTEDNPPGAAISDLMVATGAIEPIQMTAEARTQELDRLFAIAARPTNLRERRPGYQCYSCACIATCGQYPPDRGVRIGRWQRTILLTKTELLTLSECHRRVAWKRLHAIPKDDDPADSTGAARGTRFHDVLAATLTADDPAAEFESQLAEVDPEYRDEIQSLYTRHLAIEESHVPVDVNFTEYQVGATLVATGIESDSKGRTTPGKPIAVTVIARTDAVGREPDGTPAVIEHRTGANSDRIDEREMALYALSVARLVKSDTVAIHQHALDAEGGPRCERLLYTAESLAGAAELLTRTIEPAVNWHPDDAAEPTATPGQWCAQCDFRFRCPVGPQSGDPGSKADSGPFAF